MEQSKRSLSLVRGWPHLRAKARAQLESEVSKAKKEAATPLLYEPVLRQMIAGRAATDREAMKCRRTINGRADVFIEALDAYAIPSTSILRHNLFNYDSRPGSPGAVKKPKQSHDLTSQHMERAIALWWNSFSHRPGVPIPEEEWNTLAQQMDYSNLGLNVFCKSKPEIRRCLTDANTMLRISREDEIHTWNDLVQFLAGSLGESEELERSSRT